ncbi:LacI family DNA-binding transcriptional regulator [Petroclostridium sp. X23]|uniref:LacI family DNA-binding transcriptional regulator n=1 Tax=Petroclostridium sp. X23 TaxID=3045146 RepID=UPI0024ADE622|nr:LacI family DNA-binding transcriptional regulator [Petroclostridium sp. X23]WHH59084.1 LacI family DNA-binding transcriptional regulator [Petroclostridium sp. X23]
MGVTIKDVAKKAGISTTTVSLVLNNKSNARISEKTRQLVTNAAMELNYIPNQMAVGLATKKTQTIGLLLPDVNSYHFTSLIHSIEAACKKTNYFLMIGTISSGSENELTYITNFINRGVDGIIFDPSLCSKEFSQKYVNSIASLNVPVISLGPVNASLLPNSIVPDYRQGGYIAATHLLEMGHRRIGFFITCADFNAVSAISDGYQDALDEWDIPYDSNLVFEGTLHSDSGYQCLDKLLNQNITAIFSSSDIAAYGIYRYAREHKIRIPDDLSVVGFSDITLSAALDVPLTSVSFHMDRIARKSVNLLRKVSESKEQLIPEIIPPNLILRSSTRKI